MDLHGYASLFNIVDEGGDVILPGAFAASLRASGAEGVRMLFQHDPREPVGVWLSLIEDGRGPQGAWPAHPGSIAGRRSGAPRQRWRDRRAVDRLSRPHRRA